MRSPLPVLIFLSVMILLDSYFFQAVKTVTQGLTPKARSLVNILYWSVTVICILGFLFFVMTDEHLIGKRNRIYLFSIIIGLFLAKSTAIVFLLADDLRRGVQWASGKFFMDAAKAQTANGDGISRSVFLSWLGISAGTTLFGSLLYGFGNKYKYQVIRKQIAFPNLPESFKGTRIVHISDIHAGSFTDKKAVERGIREIMKQEPDMVFFTGDLVNDRALEMEPFMDVFRQVKAPMGVYSTLGNHDYGDYARWPHKGISKEENLDRLKKVHADLGWRLLMNEHTVIEKGSEKIAVLGIENWSARGRFPKYGKMTEAHEQTESYPFKILLSHDPSHWREEVLPNYPKVDLMFSGHTHGMQFGVEIPGFKWSPVQYMYKEWAGLYESGPQKLYVNRGFGFIGYPGRVGILPEITVIELV